MTLFNQYSFQLDLYHLDYNLIQTEQMNLNEYIYTDLLYFFTGIIFTSGNLSHAQPFLAEKQQRVGFGISGRVFTNLGDLKVQGQTFTLSPSRRPV